ECKRAEELIRYQAMLVDSTNDAIIATTLSPQGEFITRTWNKGAEALYGWRAAEVLGKPTINFLQPEFSQQGTREEFRRQFLEQGYWSGEIIQRRKDGSNVVVLTSHTALHDNARKIIGAVAVHHDITEIKHMEERLAAHELLAYLGRMSGTIAHELRNPLAVVDSSAFYLERTLRDAEGKTKEHLGHMRNGVTRASNIIEKLLEMTRMKEPVLRPVDLIAFMASAVSEAKVPSNIKVALENSEGVEVLADETQLRMAVGNVLKNAIEAMGQDGNLTIKVFGADGCAEVSISDSGPGIAPENMSKIFQPLFTTKQGGVGFGLALVKTVVEKHGGKIEVRSEPGKGATFIIRLPLREVLP
ncbi:MAG: PAS domain S-box protein, partial [Chloroflexi bacterium]|nr:PAS domain S-box protein [Chloroflexota bacterium]